MPTTKSGIQGPVDAPKKPITAPVKNYPGSSKITGGKGEIITGPAQDAYKGSK